MGKAWFLGVCVCFPNINKKNYLKWLQIVSCYVIRAGFKPATPTSVVWYSIQLS